MEAIEVLPSLVDVIEELPYFDELAYLDILTEINTKLLVLDDIYKVLTVINSLLLIITLLVLFKWGFRKWQS